MSTHKKSVSWSSLLKTKQGKVLKKSYPLLGGCLRPLEEIPYTNENIICMKMYCSMTRNFTNTSLRKTLQRLKYLNFRYEENFRRFWATLKLLQLLEPQTRALCYELLRNGYTIEYQLKYMDVIDFMSQSFRFYKKKFLFKKSETDEQRIKLIELLFDIPVEFWIPIRVFPRYKYEKEGKMHFAFEPFKGTYIEHFRLSVQQYLRKLDCKSLFSPPPDLLVKVSSSRFNDGGVVKRDFERVTKSVNCGFLYQQFNPKPLETREVWLPDKSTKINNAYWMLIGRQILKKDPTYPCEDPRDTWESIKSKLKANFGTFDMSGFGFQYPREYLEVIAEEICALFYSNDLYENLQILKVLLSKVVVEMPDGKFVYPPRGIGLGYYEDLKTIGINALLSEFDPISVYGDQGIIPSYSIHNAIDKMRIFEFIIPDDKYKQRNMTTKWSGWIMNPDNVKRPKLYFSPLVSLFSGDFHWERKMILRSFSEQFPELYDKYDKILPFQYELNFGYEFYRGDSLRHFSNGGVSTKSLRVVGHLKSALAERMLSPSDIIHDDFIYQTPFFTEWKRSDAKAFSLKRKETYKKTPWNCSSFMVEYLNPIVELNRTKAPNLGKLGSILSDAMESKLVINHKMTSGKLTYGLNAEDLYRSLVYCGRYRNPFEAYATGGYRVVSPWRGPPIVSSEMLFLVEHLQSNVDYISRYIIDRFDTRNPYGESLYNEQVTKRSKRLLSKLKEPEINNLQDVERNVKRKYNIITLDSIHNGISHYRGDTQVYNAFDIIGDMNEKSLSTNLVDVSDNDVSDEDIFLDDLEDSFSYSDEEE